MSFRKRLQLITLLTETDFEESLSSDDIDLACASWTEMFIGITKLFKPIARLPCLTVFRRKQYTCIYKLNVFVSHSELTLLFSYQFAFGLYYESSLAG